MSLVNVDVLLEKAEQGNYAVGAFNCNNMEIVQAIIEAAEEEQAPVIIQASQGAISYLRNAIALKPSLREAAKTDVEFARLFNSPEFQAL